MTRGEAFPRPYRLTETDEYSSVFGFRRAIRGSRFLLHYGPPPAGSVSARLGLVIGKKCLKLAVGRNRVKRIIREQFRRMRPDLPVRDLIFRLTVTLAKPNRRDCREIAAEVRQLLGKLCRDGKAGASTGKTPS